MKLAIFSDSHDHLTNISKAIDIFIEKKVDKIIHCGDLVSPFIKRAMCALDGKDIEALGVFGNNDGEREHMNMVFGKAMRIKGDFMELTLNEVKISVYHGTDQRILDNLIKSQKYDLVLTGHTHEIRMEKYEKTYVLNPGETCGYLTGKATCAIVDLSKKPIDEDSIEIIEIK